MTNDHRITLPFDLHRENCPINYLSIPNSLIKPLSKLLKYPIEANNPNFELTIAVPGKRFVANVLHVDSRHNGLIGSNSLLKSLELEVKKKTEFIFMPISHVKNASEVTFGLVMDKSYCPEWLSSLYCGNLSIYDSPENIIKMTFTGLTMYKHNIFQIYLLGKLCTVTILSTTSNGISNSNDDYPIRIDECTKITFDLPNRANNLCDTPMNSSVYGMDYLLNFLKWHVFIPLSYPEFHKKNNINSAKGVLLWGPPGCGKSFIAKHTYHLHTQGALKNWLKVDKLKEFECIPPEIILTSSTKLISDLPGQSVKNITQLFHTRNKCGKVIFIDEIDGIASKRDTNQNIAALVALLCEMDSCVNSNSDICIIGLTNRPNDLDSAIRRPGRFDSEIHVGVPNSSQRFELLKGLLSEINYNLSDTEIKTLSDQCSAFVAADLKGLINKCLTTKSKQYLQDDITDMIITFDDLLEARKGLSPSGLREIYVEIPYTKWTDIGGYEDVKLLLKQSVEWPCKKKKILDKFAIKPPRGILLYGPPGCSKTMMARAVATSSHMNFISIKGPELFSKWVGESERSIRQIFFIARANSPCVIFFDEIDSIAKSRQSEGVSEVGNRVLSQLLNEMDGINSTGELVVIGATNRPDVLDPALLRPGRFDRLIYVKLPDLQARKHILKINLSKLSLDPSLEIDELVDELSYRTKGYSGAEIEAICRESALRSISQFISSSQVEHEPEDTKVDTQMCSIAIHVTIDDIEYALKNVQCRTKDELLGIYSNFNC